ncbi:MAG: hypothetical protein AAF680_00950 [Pseudomonadota bacterium]
MLWRKTVLLGSLTLLLSCSGCTQWYYTLGQEVALSDPASLEGESLAAALAALGPPLRFAASDQDLVMAWESWRIVENSVGASLGFAGADFLNVDWGSAKISGDFLIVTFDEKKRVSAIARVRRDDSLGSGAAIQPIYGFVEVTSVEDLLEPLPAHEWGGAQLTRLPAALNLSQQPGLGNTGVEQRGTPAAVGARTQAWED